MQLFDARAEYLEAGEGVFFTTGLDALIIEDRVFLKETIPQL